ncbi:MAG: universal stress protein [Deltaproteobacteria bacterium]|nr:universal stress protein [Deltaproteobacteria bacterium]
MKIMVGYDRSNAAKEAVKVAKKRAKDTDATVYVLTSMVQGSEKEQEDIRKAEHELDYVKAIFERDNIPCEVHLLIRGLSPGEDIVNFAKEKHIDEIILGVEKKSKVGKFIFGSTAQYVILEAPCPVVTVK